MKTKLNKDNPVSEKFEIRHRIEIALVGKGEVEIQRLIGGEWLTVTSEDGTPMQWVSADEGVVFNSFLTANGPSSLPHRVVCEAGEFTVSTHGEKRKG